MDQRALEAVDQRLQAGFDDVLVDADGAPLGHAVAGLDEHARVAAVPVRRVDDADLVVGQADLLQMRIEA